ncbi:valacyclovir hydrolase-like [Condylostylus longicornis]|uniref:valacyclovir hydrolase-like n=1 Tax=Condylostylus longicornis TaxID=2530218 RepID=UPI00244DCE74|nr:valacyclovir hydrolase-like [Condylostylus longicornis]
MFFSKTKFANRMLSTQIKEKKIKISSNISINFVQSGEGPKNILCMPGALGSAWTDFKPQLEFLPKLLPEHRIIAWDPPGYGKSTPPKKNFTVNFFNKDAEYAHELMLELNSSKYSILGWSDGGVTAMILAATQNKIVEKLVIWGANASINDEDIKLLEAMRDVKTWSPRMREAMEKVYGVEGFQKLWTDWLNTMLSIYNEKGGNFCKEEVEKISCPTLIVHGKKDPMISKEHVPYLKKKIANCRYYEFPEGKHNIHLRYAEEFNKLVSEFLRS